MQPIEKITSLEKDMIRTSIDHYVEDQGASRSVTIDYILRFWNENKQFLFDKFGENLILEKEVEFDADKDHLVHEMSEMLTKGEGREFYDEFYRTFCWTLNNNFPAHMERLLDTNALVENVYHGETMIVSLPSEKEMKIVEGAKCTRILSRLSKEFHLEHFEDFRLKHSQILNQKKFTGTLCLSIHPMDYITMSDNNSDWTSCMSWEDNGCYRRGTVEMMNSRMVIVAYLKSKNDMLIAGYENYPWANKKWRELFVVNDELITNVLGYPYRNDNLTKACLEWIVELIGKENYTKNIYEYHTWENTYIEELHRDVYVDPSTDAMYNDFSSHQLAYFSMNLEYEDVSNNIRFCYSGESECMLCGEVDEFDCEGDLACLDCLPASYCDCCGDRCPSEDLTEVDGEYLCPYCYDNNVYTDSITGEGHLARNMEEIYLAESPKKVFSNDAIWITDPEYLGENEEQVDLSRYFSKVHTIRRYWNIKRYVLWEELTGEGKELFGYREFEDYEEMKNRDPYTFDWSDFEEVDD